jgi:hypothetical protein
MVKIMDNGILYTKYTGFHKEYLLKLPLPLAQLYSRIYNAKDVRSCHDNAFYLCEALIKLTASALVAAYLREVRHSGNRNENLDGVLKKLALPSLGHWLEILRTLAKYFQEQENDLNQPHASLWQQLSQQHKQMPGLLALYQRIKNGPDAKLANDRSCSLLQLFDALVQYRNITPCATFL